MSSSDREPMSDAEIEELREEMEAQHEEIREYLDEQGVDSEAWGTGSYATKTGGDAGE